MAFYYGFTDLLFTIYYFRGTSSTLSSTKKGRKSKNFLPLAMIFKQKLLCLLLSRIAQVQLFNHIIGDVQRFVRE